jgi:hypothetical protein
MNLPQFIESGSLKRGIGEDSCQGRDFIAPIIGERTPLPPALLKGSGIYKGRVFPLPVRYKRPRVRDVSGDLELERGFRSVG